MDDYTLDEALDNFKIGALGEIRDADLARQIETAQKNPRSLRKFQDKLRECCTLSEGVAASCTYSKPRAGGNIIGPSVRMAELLVHSYGNLHVSTTIIECNEDYVIVRGSVIDLEANTLTEGDVRRNVQKRRSTRKGERDRDAEGLATASGTAIAYRNAVFKAIPRALWEEIWYESQKAAMGKGTMQQRRKKALDLYEGEFGATEEQVLVALGRAGVEEITVDDLRHLRGMVTSIRTGSLSIDEAMRPPEPEPRQRAGQGQTSGAGEKLQRRRHERTPTPAQPESRPDPAPSEPEVDPETGEVHEPAPNPCDPDAEPAL